MEFFTFLDSFLRTIGLTHRALAFLWTIGLTLWSFSLSDNKMVTSMEFGLF